MMLPDDNTQGNRIWSLRLLKAGSTSWGSGAVNSDRGCRNAEEPASVRSFARRKGSSAVNHLPDFSYAIALDADRVGIDLQVGDAEPPEMIPPRRLIGKVPVGMAGQGFDDRAGQSALAHVGLGIDHVIGVAGPQHFQEVQPALRGGEGGEVIVANLCAVA